MKIHFVGIGGMGLSALASYFHSLGNEVSGSDLSNTSTIESLKRRGIRVKIGHGVVGEKTDLVVRSSAVQKDDPEIAYAHEKGIPVIERMDFFSRYIEPLVGVTGTDGKSSTTCMIAWIAFKNGLDPTLLCGALSKGFGGSNFRKGSGGIIAEVDESDPKMRDVKSEIAVLTNLRYDHLNRYENDPKKQLDSVKKFLGHARKSVTPYNFDYKSSITFGKNGDLEFEVLDSSFSKQMFKVKYKMQKTNVQLPVVGMHQVENALAAIGAGILLGIPLKDCVEALEDYPSLRRRLEVLWLDPVIISDYAHTPEEVNAAINAVVPYFKNITVVFEPHRYTRFERDHRRFAEILSRANKVLVTDIFEAFEKDEMDPRILVEELHDHRTDSEFVKISNVVSKLLEIKSEVYLFMGAGKIDDTARGFVKRLEDSK